MMELQTSNIQLQNEMPNDNNKHKKIFDIRERLLKFAMEILFTCRSLPRTPEGEAIRKQLARAGTAIGANFEEADGALTKKDFLNKAAIARKEAKETMYWLKLIGANFDLQGKIRFQIEEIDEIIRILSTILKNAGYKFRL